MKLWKDGLVQKVVLIRWTQNWPDYMKRSFGIGSFVIINDLLRIGPLFYMHDVEI